MGQYYIAIILGEKGAKEFIRLAVSSLAYANGAKLTEHCYVGNSFVEAVEYLLSPNGILYKSRLVWAGDYADTESDSDENLYTRGCDEVSIEKLNRIHMHVPPEIYQSDLQKFPYIVNHTKQLYVKKPAINPKDYVIDPLPILTAEGNGRGGGDYKGTDIDLVGCWARDSISMEVESPTTYTELVCNFIE